MSSYSRDPCRAQAWFIILLSTCLLYYAGGLKLDLFYIQYTAEVVWYLSRELIEVNFNGGIVDKLVKSKR